MNASGLVLLVAGAWVLCQVLGGNALARLGIVAGAPAPAAPSQPAPPSSGGGGGGGGGGSF